MDPLSAIGIAASIVQFLDFSQKLVSGTLELYRASDGATSYNSHLEYITNDLSQLCGTLERASQEGIGEFKAKSEAGLVPLVTVRL